jgi:AcrR family transcriptional regulator
MPRTRPAKELYLPRKSPLQERSGVTVDAILEAAVRILLAHGYSALTTKAMADRAGVSVGSLYQYFPNKQAIVAELIRRHLREVITVIDATPALQGAGLEPNVQRVMERFVAAKIERQAISAALKAPIAEIQGRAIVMDAARGLVQSMAVRLGAEIGRPWTEADTMRLGLAIASVEGVIWQVIERSPDALIAPGFAETLTQVFLAAFGAPAGDAANGVIPSGPEQCLN